ncbi:Glycosyltransferase involved in cell wall bisynthesis [Salegentibacter echinorum]|uniref:Glycosyltransferase involved in cell wall bisynthesis n=1 Tax=Salegentibacter echinorum TaxID=1073325 RepID=A0A1M5JX62_SALEC|nr:glycosyltransferase family 4 protein [Salegentibacter echinorum]SHG44613.1 Glycosyltransferase involved in cell wall bisynthesis [Salegentibacter echinorum]
MKILLVSIASPHFFNWTKQLEGSGHQVYWLDVYDSGGYFKQIDFVHQITGWRRRWDYPGRHRLKRKLPVLNKLINIFNEQKLEKVFEEKLKQIKPDVVHSFVMYLATAPILKVMQQNPQIKWIYSSWGSDLYYFRNEKAKLLDIQKTLPCINYLFTDCKRDYNIAQENGFKGSYLGTFPGGGGFSLKSAQKFVLPLDEKDILLIKGYQGRNGKAVEVLKSVTSLKEELKDYKIVVFGAPQEVFDYVANSKELLRFTNLKLFGQLPHREILKLMGKAKIYIGNSTSDGMPNTLLEAIIMEVFSIQSNPGGATAEIIKHGKNGLLIKNPGDSNEIAKLILKAIETPDLLKSGITYNTQNIKPNLEREKIKKQVLKKYKLVENNLL